jgi:hypothetical protein
MLQVLSLVSPWSLEGIVDDCTEQARDALREYPN